MFSAFSQLSQSFPDAANILIGENLIIAFAYLAIGCGIAYGIWRNREAGIDPIVTTIAVMFWSCSLGHGTHGLKGIGLPYATAWQVGADLLTVGVALRFLSYYESFDVLARISQIAASKAQLEEKNELLENTISKLQEAQSQLVEKAQLEEKNRLLQETLATLQSTQAQLIQAEKMSSLGGLVAGIAHEVNNPVNFIAGNLKHIESYSENLLSLVTLYDSTCTENHPVLQDTLEEIDLPFIQADLPKLINSMKLGADRIREIVLSLRNFSRKDEAIYKQVDIHQGIDSTLMILQHRLQAESDKPAITIDKGYGELPLVECYAGQLNQVFMNILANAIDALDETTAANRPSREIGIYTSVDEGWVHIKISDNGMGMPASVVNNIFNPFFTTKPVGQGQGIGLSISYQVVVDKHNGKIECHSEPDKGTTFIIQVPIQQSKEIAAAAELSLA